MRKLIIFLLGYFLISSFSPAQAQQANNQQPAETTKKSPTEAELKIFFDEYAEDLRQSKREAIANRYDTRGYYRVGNGAKAFVSFADVKNRYLTRWTSPKSFEWKDLSFDIISDNTASVTHEKVVAGLNSLF